MMRVCGAHLGWIRGGLGLTNFAASMLLGGITGTTVADAASTGGVMIPGMKKVGYPAHFSAAVTAASSTVGPIIPPSVAMIIVGAVRNILWADISRGGGAGHPDGSGDDDDLLHHRGAQQFPPPAMAGFVRCCPVLRLDPCIRAHPAGHRKRGAFLYRQPISRDPSHQSALAVRRHVHGNHRGADDRRGSVKMRIAFGGLS